MSLYNMLHGNNPNAGAILKALNIDLAQVDRFRDASFAKDGDAHVLRVFCRTGGGNREDYANDHLTSHPLYLRDHDDDYDCTYAHYYFKIPQEVLDAIAAQGLSLDDVTDNTTLEDRTQRAIDARQGTMTITPEQLDEIERRAKTLRGHNLEINSDATLRLVAIARAAMAAVDCGAVRYLDGGKRLVDLIRSSQDVRP